MDSMQSTLNKLPPANNSSQKQLRAQEGREGTGWKLGFTCPAHKVETTFVVLITLPLLCGRGVEGKEREQGEKADSPDLQIFPLVAKRGQEVKRSQSSLGPSVPKYPGGWGPRRALQGLCKLKKASGGPGDTSWQSQCGRHCQPSLSPC